MIYEYSNRRRAKDAIITLLDCGHEDDTQVAVLDGNIYIDVCIISDEVPTIMHFGMPVSNPARLAQVADINKVTEVYKGASLRKFKV